VRQGSSLLGLSGKSPLISTTCGLFIFSYTLSIPAGVCLDSSLSSRSPVQPSASISQRSPPSYPHEPVQLAQHDPSCGRGAPPERPRDWAHHRKFSGPGSHYLYYPFHSPDPHRAQSPMEASPRSAPHLQGCVWIPSLSSRSPTQPSASASQ